MPGSSKKWQFELLLGGLRGITVSRGGKQVTNSKGTLLGPIVNVSTPSTRKSCYQAKDFLEQALQVLGISMYMSLHSCVP